mmetsp:Transcript_25351/g.70925  ORF Transcript_25351/g.70925 Transcript_25351/m.70925 type:complete len:267 (-) Transcript_25351:333-1133(-)
MNGEEPGNWFHGGSKCGGRAGRKGFRRMTKRQPRGALEPSVPSSSVILIKESNVIDAAVSHNSKRGWDGFGSSRQSCQLAPLYSQPSREVRAGGVAAKEHLAAVHSDNAKLFHEEVPGLDQLKCLFLGGRLVAVQIQRGPRRAAATEFTGQSVVNRRAHNGLGARGDKVAAQLCPLTAGTGAPQTPMSENEQWERGIVRHCSCVGYSLYWLSPVHVRALAARTEAAVRRREVAPVRYVYGCPNHWTLGGYPMPGSQQKGRQQQKPE